jgi:hypothetical protein
MSHQLDPHTLFDQLRAMAHQHRLVLFSLRRMAFEGLDDALAANAMLNQLGLRYRRPLILLRVLMAEIVRVAQRPITVAPCCCLRTTPAETALLDAIACASADPQGASDLLRPFLGVRHCLGVVTTAAALSEAFADLGRPL